MAVVLTFGAPGAASAADSGCGGRVEAASAQAVVLKRGPQRYVACDRRTGRRTVIPSGGLPEVGVTRVVGRWVEFAQGSSNGSTVLVLDARDGSSSFFYCNGLCGSPTGRILPDGRKVVGGSFANRGGPGGSTYVKFARPGREPRDIVAGGLFEVNGAAVSAISTDPVPVTRLFWTDAQDAVRTQILPNVKATSTVAGPQPLRAGRRVVNEGGRCAGSVLVADPTVVVLADGRRATLCDRRSGRRTRLGFRSDVRNVQLDNGWVLFEGGDTLLRVRSASGKTTVLAAGTEIAGARAFFDGTVVFASDDGDAVQVVAVAPGGKQRRLAAGSGIDPESLAAGAGRVYWLQDGIATGVSVDGARG